MGGTVIRSPMHRRAHGELSLPRDPKLAHIVALKSIYPLLSLHCTRISGCACAERWWALLKVCRAGTLT